MTKAGSCLSEGHKVIHWLTSPRPQDGSAHLRSSGLSLQLLCRELVLRCPHSRRVTCPGPSITQASGKRTWHQGTATDPLLQRGGSFC